MPAPQFGKTSTAHDDKTTMQDLGAASRFTTQPLGESSRKKRETLHQDAQIGLPAVEPEQRIMIGTEPRGQTLPGDGLVEHATERWTVDGHGLHPKADDPAGKLIQDDQHPVTPDRKSTRLNSSHLGLSH